MPWPIPSTKTIFERAAAELEQLLSEKRPDIDPLALSRAVRSNHGMISIITRAFALELREIHDHIAFWSCQYFPDTAEEEFVLRHAGIWGVARRGATHAVGSVVVEGIAGTALPQHLEMMAGGNVRFETLETAVIGAGGMVEVSAKAKEAGFAGNVAAGSLLKTVIPFAALTKITVAAAGFNGGFEEETYQELREAVLARIRQPPHGGAGFDYQEWLKAKFPVRAVAVKPDWIGRGSVGLIVTMRDGAFGRTPTEQEKQTMLDYLGAPGSNAGVRPVTAHVVMVGASPQVINLTIRLRPDNSLTRAAIVQAWRAFILNLGGVGDTFNPSPIGATIERSRIIEALSAADGEYAHDLMVPADNITLGVSNFAVAGQVTFAEAL